MSHAVDLENFTEPNPCRKCGADFTDLAVPDSVVCTICKEVCYNPCRKGKTEQHTDEKRPCLVRVATPFRAKDALQV